MTPKPPRPGAHNQLEGVPPESLDFVREMGGPITPEQEQQLTAVQAQALREFFDREARTLTVRFTYKRKGHPRAALESVLTSIPKSVFETEILDEH